MVYCSKKFSLICVVFIYESCTLLKWQIYMYRRLTLCVSVGLSFKPPILSFHKDYILVHRAILKCLSPEYQPSLLEISDPRAILKWPKLNFLPVETPVGLSTGRLWNSTRLDFLPWHIHVYILTDVFIFLRFLCQLTCLSFVPQSS